jgi:hypothetical protein
MLAAVMAKDDTSKTKEVDEIQFPIVEHVLPTVVTTEVLATALEPIRASQKNIENKLDLLIESKKRAKPSEVAKVAPVVEKTVVEVGPKPFPHFFPPLEHELPLTLNDKGKAASNEMNSGFLY